MCDDEHNSETDATDPGQRILIAEPGRFVLVGQPPTIVLASGDRNLQEVRVEVNSPTFRSSASAAAGEVHLAGAGRPDVGIRGEARVAKLLGTVLRANGIDARIERGENEDDQRGIDCWVYLPTRKIPMQIVTIPADQSYWQAAAQREASRELGNEAAISLLRRAIVQKRDAGRWKLVLAMDAQHTGVFARDEIVAGYIKQFGPPAAEFGFASVWIVGPTAAYVCRLGGDHLEEDFPT